MGVSCRLYEADSPISAPILLSDNKKGRRRSHPRSYIGSSLAVTQFDQLDQ